MELKIINLQLGSKRPRQTNCCVIDAISNCFDLKFDVVFDLAKHYGRSNNHGMTVNDYGELVKDYCKSNNIWFYTVHYQKEIKLEYFEAEQGYKYLVRVVGGQYKTGFKAKCGVWRNRHLICVRDSYFIDSFDFRKNHNMITDYIKIEDTNGK